MPSDLGLALDDGDDRRRVLEDAALDVAEPPRRFGVRVIVARDGAGVFCASGWSVSVEPGSSKPAAMIGRAATGATVPVVATGAFEPAELQPLRRPA